MSELLSVLETLVADVDAGRPVALCAVVRTKGSTPQSPGAAMLVRADMSTLGTLGGGCVEAEVRKRAFELMQAGRSSLLDYVLDHDFGWDDGLICGGRMYVAVTSLNASDTLPSPARAIAEYRSALERARRRETAEMPVFTQSDDGDWQRYRVHLEVPPTLLIAGAGHVGAALARVATNLDFHVVVLDDRADFANPEKIGADVQTVVGEIARELRNWPIDASTYVAIVTRGHRHDQEALSAVIGSSARYIGLIGSRRKSRMILEELAAAGATRAQIARVHTPIGLAIGAVTVPEIAVSIAAELVQIRRENQAGIVEGPLTWDPDGVISGASGQ